MSKSYKREYAIGDACWIHLGTDPDNPTALSPGKVVHSFELPHHVNGYYVIEMTDEPGIMNLEVRDPLLMSPTETTPPLWSRSGQV